MFFRGFYGIALFASVLALQPASNAASAVQTVVNTKPVVLVTVRTVATGKDRAVGSGFVLTDTGFLLTARHLVADFDASSEQLLVSVGSVSSFPTPARIIDCASGVADACLLKIDGADVTSHQLSGFYPLSCVSPKLGDSVRALGYPEGEPLIQAPGDITGELKGDATFPMSAGVISGMSGGPVFGPTMSVVGIVRGGATGAGTMTFLTPLSSIRSLLEEASVECEVSHEAVPAENDLDDGGGGGAAAVDVALIIDDSTSMRPEQQKFAAGLHGFLASLKAKGFDFQICLLTTDVKYYKGTPPMWGQFKTGEFKEEFRVLTPGQKNVNAVIDDTVQHLGAEWSSDERAIESLNLMLAKNSVHACIRPAGVLIAIVISDEDERSVGGVKALSAAQYEPLEKGDQPSTLLENIKNEFPQKKFFWNAIIVKPGDDSCKEEQDGQESPSFVGRLYEQLTKSTGGYDESICAKSFDKFFQVVSSKISTLMSLP